MSRLLLASLFTLTACAHPSANVNANANARPNEVANAKPPEPALVPPVLKRTTEVKLGTVERSRLPNGTDLILVPRHEVPAVDIVFALRAGGNADPVDRAGLAQFTASMLRKGTKKRSADQISEAIDAVGGDLDAGASDEEISISCRARSRDFTLCVDLASDILRNPIFPEKEMDEVREQLKAAIEGAKDSPAALAAAHVANLYFGDNDIRGRSLSQASLAGIDRKSLVEFHKRYFGPKNLVVAIAGDFDPATAKKLLAQRLGDWRVSVVAPPPEPALPPMPSRLRIRLVDKPNATQSNLILMGPGLAHRSPDFFAVQAMNYTLGAGGFSSRLMQAVRSDGGKTYGATSSFAAARDTGLFSASTFTRNPETVNTLKLVLDEIKKMREQGPRADELEAAKNKLIGGYGLRLETGTDLSRSLVRTLLHALPEDYVLTYPQKLEAVTLADTQRSAKEHLAPCVLAIVGKAAEVRPLLTAAGLEIDEEVLYTAPVSAKERAPVAAKPPAGVSLLDDGKKLLEDAWRAMGGDAIARVKDVTSSAHGSLTTPQGSVPVRVAEKTLLGSASYVELDMAPFKMIQAISDGKGYIQQEKKKRPIPEDVARQMMRALTRDPLYVLRFAKSPGVLVTGAMRAKLRGLQITSADGETFYLWLDAASQRVQEISYREDGKDARDVLSGYRTIDGVQVPFTVQRELGDGSRMDVTYESVKLNAGVPATLFRE